MRTTEIIPISGLLDLITEAVNLGRRQALIDLGIDRRFISQQEAFRRYGKANVERWRDERLISPTRDEGNTRTLRYDAERLTELSLSINTRHLLDECEIRLTLRSDKQ